MHEEDNKTVQYALNGPFRLRLLVVKPPSRCVACPVFNKPAVLQEAISGKALVLARINSDKIIVLRDTNIYLPFIDNELYMKLNSFRGLAIFGASRSCGGWPSAT
ncbi:MAG: hypothetical protein EOO57_10585 [Hymenobacter sp.]|nr:MAG: hypothetical protein EOO57_10585 [Hymenobacter sp.]